MADNEPEPDSNRRTLHWPGVFVAVALSVVSGAAIQFAIAIRWTGVIEERVAFNDARIKELDATLGKIDVGGTRNIPAMQERITSLEKSDQIAITRLNNLTERVDTFIQQVNRSETPLAKKVDGIVETATMLRENLNTQTAITQSRMENTAKRLDNIFDQLSNISKDLIEIRNRITVVEAQARGLKELADSRTAFMDKAHEALEDQAALKVDVKGIHESITRIEERIGRVVQALDATYALVNEHLRQQPPSLRKDNK